MAIARVGTLVSIEGFSKLCINIDVIVVATMSAVGPTPIISQFCLEFTEMVNSLEWKMWYKATGSDMPELHWKCYKFMGSSWCSIGSFATDFISCSVVDNGEPMTQLHTQGLTLALMAFKTFRTTIVMAQLTMSPIATSNQFSKMLSVVVPGKDAKKHDVTQTHSPKQGGSDGKCEEAAKASTSPKDVTAKKTKHGPRADTMAPTQADRGTFIIIRETHPWTTSSRPISLRKYAWDSRAKGRSALAHRDSVLLLTSRERPTSRTLLSWPSLNISIRIIWATSMLSIWKPHDC